MPLRLTSTILLLLLRISLSYGQRAPITWNYKADRVKPQEWILTMRASLASGWHIYSQQMDEGGPIPTRITLSGDDEYTAIGAAVEKGKAFVFYDSLYEMKITWYAEEVSFLQRVLVHPMALRIQGSIEYMACNSDQCVPLEETFTITIQP